jgi:hypothetical protein
MENIQIPILLVAGRNEATIKLKLNDQLVITATVTPQEVIAKRGIVESSAEIVLADIKEVDRSDIIECALLLRNAGRTVIVGEAVVVPLDLVRDLHNFTVKAKSEAEVIRTEVLVMEEAMQAFGDITDVVAAFEKKYFGN